jgi:hypothetical protein
MTTESFLKIVDPEPPQDRHRVGAVPGLHRFPLQAWQVPFLEYFRLKVVPLAASKKLKFITFVIFSPFLFLEDPAE